MAYTRTSFPAYADRTQKYAFSSDFSGGIVAGKDILTLNDNQSPFLLNLDAFDGRLKTRMGQTSVFGTTSLCSSIHSMTKKPFYNSTIIHSGTNIYRLSYGQNEPVLLFSDMPDHKSVFCSFGAKLYIYCSLRIYSIDRDFNVTEEMPYAPVLFKNQSYQIPNGTRDKNVDLNLAAPCVGITYRNSESISTFVFPIERDSSRPIRAIHAGQVVDPSAYTSDETKLTFKKAITIDEDHPFQIDIFAKKHKDIGFEDKFSDCEMCIGFGGTTISGTRVFMTGNENLPGYYFKSSLLDPLRFDESSYDIIGDGSQNITCLTKQYGNLIVFTDSSVLRMNYDFLDGESVFTIKELSSDIGCDMPGTVEIIDNRVVFASSRKGVFLIDNTDDFGEQNIKPISTNINNGENFGLLNEDKENLLGAFSIDYNRKYYLCVGEHIYVWDYNARFYSGSSDYTLSGQKLIWYFYDGIKAKGFFELDGKLFTAGTGVDSGFAFFEDTGMDFGVSIPVLFRSKNYDLSYPYLYKNISEISLEAALENRTDLCIFDNGTKHFETTFSPLSQSTLHIRVPSRKSKLFGFEIQSKGRFSLNDICVKYTTLQQ